MKDLQLNNNNQFPTPSWFQSQVTRPKIANPNSESSSLLLNAFDDTFTYDISNLPDSDSILLEIFTRLPLESVFMFKCVSKHWLTLISHSSFKTLYISRMQAANPVSLPFRILYKYTYDSDIEGLLDLLSYNSSDPIYSLYRDPEQNVKFKVLAASNGLILCCSWQPLRYFVCDPVSRQRVTLSYRNFFHMPLGEGFVTSVDDEHNVVTSFTVVVPCSMSSSNVLILDIFSSETGKWSEYRLRCPSSITVLRRSACPIVFNGILHWFACENGMLAFDPCKEPKSCRLIRFPNDLDVPSEDRHDMLYRLCDGCQGKLRVFQVASDVSSFYCFSMWEMKDYEKGEWCSELKVTRSDLSSSDPELDSWLVKATFLPLSFDPLNLDIVYMRCVELACVVSYSIRNRRLDVACRLTGVTDDLSWRVVVPFVIPRWPTRVPVRVPREFNESKDMEFIEKLAKDISIEGLVERVNRV